MTEFERALQNLIVHTQNNIAVRRTLLRRKGRSNDTATEALEKLKAALVALQGSAAEYDDLVPKSRLSLRTIEGRISSGDPDGARDYIENVPFRGIVLEQEKRFKDAAAEIYRARKSRPLGLFVEKPRAVIVENIRTLFGMQPVGQGVDPRNELFSRLAHLRSWSRGIDAAFYWIGHAAELAYLTGDLPSQPEEDDFNAALPLALQTAAAKHWSSLASALGYSTSLPFEIGRFISTRRTIEPQTGLDFALIVYLRLEDGDPRIYTAIIQGKPEHATKPFIANVHRRSTTHGGNHQLRALADKAQTACYAFYPNDREASPTSFVQVETVVNELERRLPDVAFKDMKAKDCYVSIEAGAVDLPTFFSKLLLNGAGHKTMSQAINDLGSPRPSLGDKARDMSSLLAKRLILVEVGSRIPQAELKPILELGFKRSADFGMAKDMSPGSGGRTTRIP